MFWNRNRLKKIDKFDDEGWHEKSTGGNQLQAATHIAMAFYWLVSRKYIKLDDQELNENIKSKKQTPAELFLRYSDGKLVSYEGLDEVVAEFLSNFYRDEYLTAVGENTIAGVHFDKNIAAPYNMGDSWDNAEAVAKFLDREFAKWKGTRANASKSSER